MGVMEMNGMELVVTENKAMSQSRGGEAVKVKVRKGCWGL